MRAKKHKHDTTPVHILESGSRGRSIVILDIETSHSGGRM
jgi:hypothetical protein